MPPNAQPLPRFIAEPPHEAEPRGRWRETLEREFRSACEALEEMDELGDSGETVWFPDRTFGGRTYVPAALSSGDIELFGYVSFSRAPETGEARDFVARADFTDETADAHPDWKLDLNEEVIGTWRGTGETSGELTLVWGTALIAGGAIATAELAGTTATGARVGETVDQCELSAEGRLTLVGLDAINWRGDDLYLEVSLWGRRGEPLATESLYEPT